MIRKLISPIFAKYSGPLSSKSARANCPLTSATSSAGRTASMKSPSSRATSSRISSSTRPTTTKKYTPNSKMRSIWCRRRPMIPIATQTAILIPTAIAIANPLTLNRSPNTKRKKRKRTREEDPSQKIIPETGIARDPRKIATNRGIARTRANMIENETRSETGQRIRRRRETGIEARNRTGIRKMSGTRRSRRSGRMVINLVEETARTAEIATTGAKTPFPTVSPKTKKMEASRRPTSANLQC